MICRTFSLAYALLFNRRDTRRSTSPLAWNRTRPKGFDKETPRSNGEVLTPKAESPNRDSPLCRIYSPCRASILRSGTSENPTVRRPLKIHALIDRSRTRAIRRKRVIAAVGGRTKAALHVQLHVNYAASVDRPRTVRRRQRTALIWVSLKVLARTRCCPGRRTWEHNPNRWMASVWVAVYATLRCVLGPWTKVVVRSCLLLRSVSRGTETLLPSNGTRALALPNSELAPRRRFLINNFLPLSEFYPRIGSVSFFLASAGDQHTLARASDRITRVRSFKFEEYSERTAIGESSRATLRRDGMRVYK